MVMREKQDTVKRLMAYSAAAGLGAFGAAQSAEAAIVYVDIPDIVLNEGGPQVTLDLNSDGIDDIAAQMLGNSQAWFLRFRVEAINGSDEYSNLAKGNANYIRSFEGDAIIGNANPNNVPGALVLPIAQSNSTNFGNQVAPQYMSMLLEDAAGDTHWSWVRMRYDRNSSVSDMGVGTIFDYAYETDLSSVTDIVAGAVPEPGSLGLLAAGAGALSFRRRRRK